MQQLRNVIRRLLGRFSNDERAVAAVEFALVLPFMISLYFGSMEAAALFTADRRVNTISSTIGDLVSQWDNDDGAIPVATMNDYFAAAQSLVYPMSTTGLKQVVTFVKVNDDLSTSVLWSRGYNGGAAKTVGSTYALTNEIKTVAKNKWVIAAQVYYGYKPMLGVVFPTTINLYRENVFLPRFDAAITAAAS